MLTNKVSQNKDFKLLIDVLSKRQQKILFLLILIWFISLIFFWFWWLQKSHIVTLIGMFINSVFLAWNTFLPFYFYYFILRMKKPNPRIKIPEDWRVAMVVTKADSEPWLVVKETLIGMLNQSYPHDTWLADEEPQPEVILWCKQNKVKISTRKGISAYHNSKWPRRTKCKEGNLAYFYDHYGYDNYNFVSQLDADHVPSQNYLKAMIRPFMDSEVGYVAAPSICDRNKNESWSARGRLFAEATLHGALQAGYNDDWSPLCIGSHYAVRTVALREIGGLGPELAEDHTTTLMMNGNGWKGVFALDAEAHGDGPSSFSDCMLQEFQWSRSLTKVLLFLTPKYWHKLKPHLRFQFLFSQLWYPIFSVTGILGISLPLIALIINHPWVKVNYFEFIFRYFILIIVGIFPLIWLRKCGVLRPPKVKIISWETICFQYARIPWILMGILNGIYDHFSQKERIFRITPKGFNNQKYLSFLILFPYLIISFISCLIVILINDVTNAQGYYFLSLLNGITYLILATIIIKLHFQENQFKWKEKIKFYLTIMSLFLLFIIAVILRLPNSFKNINNFHNNQYSIQKLIKFD